MRREVPTDIRELNLSPREQRSLESMGFTNVEKIALCYRDDCGLGKAKGEAIIQRARNFLAYHGIKEITDTEQPVAIPLSDILRATIVSVEDVLGIYGELRRELEDNRLVPDPLHSPQIVTALKHGLGSSGGSYIVVQ